jgi:hypothetical protein
MGSALFLFMDNIAVIRFLTRRTFPPRTICSLPPAEIGQVARRLLEYLAVAGDFCRKAPFARTFADLTRLSD